MRGYQEVNMFENVKVLTHSSIRIEGRFVLYFDPFEMKEEPHDADIIFITHDHFDHFSPEDIRKAAKENVGPEEGRNAVGGDATCLVLPECMKGQEEKAGISNVKFVRPEGILEYKGLLIKAIPAYNRLKPFHTKGKNYVGYLVTMDEVTYYIAGDTDITPENQKVRCDVALVPAGGKFTMDYKEAAKLVNQIAPRLAIPTHYGTVAGSKEDGKCFAELVDKKTEVRVML